MYSAVDQHDLSTLHVLFSGAAPLGAALTKQVIVPIRCNGTPADAKHKVVDRLLAKRKNKGPIEISQGMTFLYSYFHI
jgi:hypothetical protein